MIKAIIFDFDGVILESVDIKGWAFRKLFEEYPDAVDIIVAYHYANGGVPRYDKFRHIYKEILKQPLSDSKFEELCCRFADLVFKKVLGCEFVDGALEFLEKYYKKYSFFIVSGTPHEEIQEIVKGRNLTKYFKGVFGSPTAKSVWTANILKDNGFDAKEVLWVGDALSDWRAAHENNILFAVRLWKENREVFQRVKVDFEMNDLVGLTALIDKLNKGKKK